MKELAVQRLMQWISSKISQRERRSEQRLAAFEVAITRVYESAEKVSERSRDAERTIVRHRGAIGPGRT